MNKDNLRAEGGACATLCSARSRTAGILRGNIKLLLLKDKMPRRPDAPLHRPPWPNRKRSRMMKKKVPDLTDKHVGARVRMRRMMLKMSQEKLGDALGLTFQI